MPSRQLALFSGVLLAACAFLSLRVSVGSGTGAPVLLTGDQGLFWTYGERLLRGELPYRDFFQFTPPGTDLVYREAFALFGPRVWVTNALVVGLGSALCTVCFALARLIMRPRSAVLASAVFVVWVFGQLLSGTHHGWSVLFIMTAVRVLSAPESRARLWVAGGLLGLASFFTHTHAAFALLACALFVARRRHRALPARVTAVRFLGAGCAVVFMLLWAPFVYSVGLGTVWECLVGYPWRFLGYTQLGGGLGLPEALSRASLPTLAPYLGVYALTPLAYVVAHRLRVRGGLGEREDDRVRLLWLVGVALLAGVVVNLTWVRLFEVSMPAVILLAWSADRSGRSVPILRVASVATAALACLLVRSTHRHHGVLLTLPGGRVAVDDSAQDELAWLAKNAPAGGALFATNHQSLLLPLGLRNPLYLDGAIPGGTIDGALVGQVIEELEASDVQHVLSSPRPASSAPDALAAYLARDFRVVQRFGNGDEVWARQSARKE